MQDAKLPSPVSAGSGGSRGAVRGGSSLDARPSWGEGSVGIIVSYAKLSSGYGELVGPGTGMVLATVAVMGAHLGRARYGAAAWMW